MAVSGEHWAATVWGLASSNDGFFMFIFISPAVTGN